MYLAEIEPAIFFSVKIAEGLTNCTTEAVDFNRPYLKNKKVKTLPMTNGIHFY